VSIFEGFEIAAPAPTPFKAIRIALIGTYTPRKCGIATFTSDIADRLREFRPEVGVDVYALDDPAAPLAYTDVAEVIPGTEPEAYARAARSINESGVDAVWLQHEYGIYGDDDGRAVCDFVDRLAAPLILTCHTVLADPSERQRAILCHLVTRASRIMVMSRHSRELLIREYNASAEILEVIEHGAPDRPFGRQAEFKARFGLADRKVLMTFGLLGPGKGLERAIEALPAVVARHPNTVYRIVGATHPNLVAQEGERYRDGLMALAQDLGVAEHIEWDNRFLDNTELLDQLEASDIYITPYPNLQQSTSGTLSYAVALGKAVISTPYLHATELLRDDVGKLIEPGSSEAIANAINALLDDPAELLAQQRRAYARGRETIWPRFADATARLAAGAVAPAPRRAPITATPGLSGVIAMCDSTGMLQHSIGIVPDRRHGYCLDDNVRALMLMNVAEGLHPTERMRWSMVYASFIQDAWNPDACRFRNFMRFDRGWCEDVGSDDSNGRAIWALGHTAENAADADMRVWARNLYEKALPQLGDIGSPRAIAFQILGAAAMLRAHPGHDASLAAIAHGGEFLDKLLGGGRRPDWAWFEAVLGYDNPRLSQAMIEAGVAMGRKDWITAGIETLSWICSRQASAAGVFRPIGSESFGKPHTYLPFDQQPLEAQAAIEACLTAYHANGDVFWHDHAMAAWSWFFGGNDRGVQLADMVTGRCRDGVTPRGANINCGAESILAFQLSHYAMLALYRLSTESPQGSLLEPARETAS
jgi:glycosyltransferase involved in cell wall biosynthesis